MNNFLSQKQQFQAQLMEVESAISELAKTNQSYKIIGNIMVATDKPELEKELNSKKEMLELRVKTIEKQEEKVREKTSALQKEVLEKMKKSE